MSKLSKLSSNAILAKSRAMYADSLTIEDYTALISCRSVSEIASYLKTHTKYGKNPSFAADSRYSRSRLEAQIRRYAYTEIAELAAFEGAIGGKLNEIIYLNYDVTLILACADRLDTNTVSDLSLFIPEKIKKHSSLDAPSLEMAMSFQELYNALSGTRYQKPLDIFIGGKATFSIPALENALYRYMCGEIKKIVKKNCIGTSQKEILELFEAKSDFKMFESIYRMKKYFPSESLDLTKIFYSGLSALSLNEINEMLLSNSAEEALRLFKASKYGKYLDEKNIDRLEKCTRIALQTFFAKQLRFSTVPEVVMFCYMFILDNEVKNIIHITEGVRYALPPEEIENFLIFGKKE